MLTYTWAINPDKLRRAQKYVSDQHKINNTKAADEAETEAEVKERYIALGGALNPEKVVEESGKVSGKGKKPKDEDEAE